MIATPICAVEGTFATSSDAGIYTVPANSTFIIDKFTAVNIDGSTHTLNVNIIPSGGVAGSGNLVLDAASILTTVTRDCTELQNQILNTGDQISIKADAGSAVTVRVSGRLCA
jgi:hypothetical protein